MFREAQPPIAWITGASSGIGAALAMQLAKAGWQVAVSARNRDALEKLAATQQGITPFPHDVTSPDAVHATVRDIEARLGAIRLAVLNAGDYTPMGLDHFDADLFEHLMRVNYMGVVHGIDALRGPMLERGSGQILVTASVAGYRGLPLAAPYGATKAALISMAESLHPEFARHGVRLRVVNPGFVKSSLTAKNDFPMPSLIEPDQAAESIFKALDHPGFEISFPTGFVLAMKLLRALPYALYFPMIRRITGQ